MLELTPFKSVFDLIAQLLTASTAHKKTFFTTHVEPLHEKIVQIHKDYQNAFSEALRQLSNSRMSSTELAKLRKLLDFLRKRRRDYEAERQLVRALGSALRKAKRKGLGKNRWELVEAYCQAIISYFSSGEQMGIVAGYSWFSDFIEIVERKARMLELVSKREVKNLTEDVWFTTAISGNPHRHLRESVEEVLNHALPKAYSEVCSRYAALRAGLL